MQHLSDPLNALHADCAWFARAREVRLLVVRTSGDLRKTVTTLVPRYEFHADTHSPWVFADDAFEPGAPGWESRAARLLRDWERRRAAFARVGTPMPSAVPRPPARVPAAADPGLNLFIGAGAAVLDAQRAPLDGVVLVLAPTVVTAPDALDADLGLMLSRPEVRGCRVVLVLDVDVDPPYRTLAWLGAAALLCVCASDPAQKRRDFQHLLTSAAPGAAPAGVTPPRRPGVPPAPDPAVRDAALRAAGIDPAYLEHAPALRRLILGAALSVGDGRFADAVELQGEAVRLSHQAGVPRMTVICQLALASYLSAAGDRPRALAEAAAAAQRAAEGGLPEQESQACLAQGLLHTLDRRPLDASAAYQRCAQLAESTDAGILAVEGWRLAGQAALEGGASHLGAQYLHRALAVAGRLDPAAQGATSAPDAARRLAATYAGWGYTAHADALYAQADAIEAAPATGESARPRALAAGV